MLIHPGKFLPPLKRLARKFGNSVMPQKYRVFLDTSALLAGLNSPSGAAGVVLSMCLAGKITAIISDQVIEEAERNILEKFPTLINAWQSFLILSPVIAPTPTLAQVKRTYKLIVTDDAPILASAILAKPD